MVSMKFAYLIFIILLVYLLNKLLKELLRDTRTNELKVLHVSS